MKFFGKPTEGAISAFFFYGTPSLPAENRKADVNAALYSADT